MAPPVAGYTVWYDAQQISSSDGTTLSTVPDESGSGNDATSTAVVYYSTTSAKLINGHPALYFGGGNNYLRRSGFSQAQPLTVYAIATFTKGNGTLGTLLDGNSSRCQIALDGNDFGGHGYYAYAGSGTAAFAPSFDANLHTVAVVYNGSSSVGYYDGTGTAMSGIGTSSLVDMLIGIANGINSTYAWQGLIGEFLLYPSAHSSGNVASTISYLNTKWALAASYISAPTRSMVPRFRATNWRGWTEKLSGLIVPPFADDRLLLAGG